MFYNKVRSVPENYIQKEIALYLDATNSADLFCKASKFWNRVKNDNGTVNSAYGNLIFGRQLRDGLTQYQWAYESLKADKDSRQAIMFFNRPDFQYQGVKDFVCTICAVAHIRNDKLYMHVFMRSNDIFRGTISDIPFFMLLQHMLFRDLKRIYPDLELGTYIHTASSLHIYYDLTKTSDIDVINEMLKSEFYPKSFTMPDNPEMFIGGQLVHELVYEKKFDQNLLNALMSNENDAKFFKWLCGEDNQILVN